MSYYEVLIEETGEKYRCSSAESLLSGMERLGKKGIPVGCRGGGCGVCKIKVSHGDIAKRIMSREHISESEEEQGTVLACRVKPLSDVHLCVIGKMQKTVCAKKVSPTDSNAGAAN